MSCTHVVGEQERLSSGMSTALESKSYSELDVSPLGRDLYLDILWMWVGVIDA